MIIVKQLRPEGDNWIKEAEFMFLINGRKRSVRTGHWHTPSIYKEDPIVYRSDLDVNTTND